MKRIMDIADHIGSRIGREEEDTADAKGFEVLANVVWAEIACALMDELGSALFATGRPDEFRKVCSSSRPSALYEWKLTTKTESRDNAVVHSVPSISCTIQSCNSSDGYAPNLLGV